MTTVVLYDLLTGAQTTGTWTQVSIPAGATGPAAPALYDDSIDFTGEPSGDYVYSYEVTGAPIAYVTVTWSDLTARFNDPCAGATFMAAPISIPFLFEEEELSNAQDCDAGIAAPTDSGEAKPAIWGAGPFTGDLWYRITAPSNSVQYVLTITVDGSPYGNTGVEYPALAIYYGATTDCTLKTLYIATSPSDLNQSVSTSVLIPATTIREIWIRVVSLTAGKFDLTIEGNV